MIRAAILLLALASCAPNIAHFTGSPAPNLALPEVALVDDAARPFTFDRLYDRGYALFFGYTHCPDTCPATLAKLEKARTALPPDVQKRTTIVFVTVDPERDTPQTLHAYMALFGPGLIGVTGSKQNLKTLYNALGIWSVRLPGHGGDYEMGHTSTVFFVDGRGKFRALHDVQDQIQDLTHDFKELTV